MWGGRVVPGSCQLVCDQGLDRITRLIDLRLVAGSLQEGGFDVAQLLGQVLRHTDVQVGVFRTPDQVEGHVQMLELRDVGACCELLRAEPAP